MVFSLYYRYLHWHQNGVQIRADKRYFGLPESFCIFKKNYTALFHQSDTRREQHRFVKVMGDKDGGLAKFAYEAGEFSLQIRSRYRIEGTERFIEEQKLRIRS